MVNAHTPLMETLTDLCRLPGVSGWEDTVRRFIAAQARPWADHMETDPMGNLMVFRKGRTAGKTLMLCAHMDEVGVIVTGITGDGYLKFDFVGGVDRRVVIGKSVYLGEKAIPGVIGIKAHHLSKGEGQKSVPAVTDLCIDIGTDTREQAEAMVSLGTVGTFAPDSAVFGHGLFRSKAIDDRLGCAVLLELLKDQPACDTWFVFTVQEEVGTRGASTVAWHVRPDAALIVEGTTAADLPGVPAHKTICKVGSGAVLPFMDRGTLYDRRMRAMLVELAQQNAIPWQTKEMIAGGTDASAIQRSLGGIPVAGVAAPLRNIHSPASIGALSDFEAVYRIAGLFMEEFAKEKEI